MLIDKLAQTTNEPTSDESELNVTTSNETMSNASGMNATVLELDANMTTIAGNNKTLSDSEDLVIDLDPFDSQETVFIEEKSMQNLIDLVSILRPREVADSNVARLAGMAKLNELVHLLETKEIEELGMALAHRQGLKRVLALIKILNRDIV